MTTDHTSKDFDHALRARELVGVMAARGLRLVMSLLGVTTDLERVGDEAKKIALYARSLAGFMVEDPRSISACLDILFVAKSLERIGDHAKNLGEHVVYAAMGKDVRHASAQEIEQALGA